MFKLASNYISNFYVFCLGRSSNQKLNEFFLDLTLKAAGYKLSPALAESGEKRFIEFLAKQKPKVCLDIGANRGNYSRLLLEHTNSKVISFEPLPMNAQSLREVSTKYKGRFEVHFCAIGNESTKTSLFYGANTELASLMNNTQNIGFLNGNKYTIEVDMMTLDSFFNFYHPKIKAIDLIKIDVEGFELEVLQGSKNTIKNLKPKFIQLEFNRHHLFSNTSIYQMSLVLNEYSLYQILPWGKLPVKRDPRKPESNVYRYSNFLFVRNNIKF
jgi:FkbM family methyltransferase